MRFDILFKELTYTEFKVLMYCVSHKENRNAQGFGSWLGMKYTTALDAWDRGMEGLENKGYIIEGKWQKKVKDVLQGKSE